MTKSSHPDDFLIRHVGELNGKTRNALLREGITTIGELRKQAESRCRYGDIEGIAAVGWYDIYQMLGINWPWRKPKGR